MLQLATDAKIWLTSEPHASIASNEEALNVLREVLQVAQTTDSALKQQALAYLETTDSLVANIKLWSDCIVKMQAVTDALAAEVAALHEQLRVVQSVAIQHNTMLVRHERVIKEHLI